jgi:hypothetical protein
MSDYRRELRDYIQESLRTQLGPTSPQAEQPSWISTALRSHQLTLLAAAKSVEARANLKSDWQTTQLLTKYGVLADRVGAGKSLVALGLIKEPSPNNTRVIIRQGSPHSDSMTIGIKQMPPPFEFQEEWSGLSGEELYKVIPRDDGRIYTTTSLIIVPHNVCPQWESYISEQTQLKAVIVKRTRDCDFDRADFLASVYGADLVLVSSTMLKKFIVAMEWKGPPFDRIIWSRLFVDEADSIACTTRYGDITARFTWFISASWLNMMFPSGVHSYTMHNLPEDLRPVLGNGVITGIQSRYGFIYNTLSDTRNAAFAPLVIRNSDAWIEESLKAPVITHETIVCKAPPNLDILRGFISPAAMEALHAGDTAGAMDILGLKASTKETLVEKVTASRRGDLLQAERILEFKKTMEYSGGPAVKAAAIEKAEQKVKRIQEQLELLECRIAGASQQNCPICYDVTQTPTLTPCCRQSFCLSCICECMSAKSACPLCRCAIGSVSDLVVIGPENMTVSSVVEEGPPTKGATLLNLLMNSSESDRFLVFSAHEASFKGLRELLSAKGIRCELLSGSGARVERLRSQFADGTIRVLCMNARHVGAGINLEAATHVVLYHRMNTELEKQVIGRAVRFERSEELKIIHLVHEAETALNGDQTSEVIVHV